MGDFRRLLSYLGRYRIDMILGAVLVFLETGAELVIPVLMSDLIDVGVAAHDMDYILHKGVQMAFCALFSLLTGLLYARFAARAAYGWGARLRDAEYQKVQAFAFSNLDHFSSASLITRLTSDITLLQNAVNGGLRPLVRGPVMLILGIVLAFVMNPELSVVFLVASPLLGAILLVIVRKIAPMYRRLQEVMDRLNNTVQENVTAIRAVKAFVRGEYEEEKFGSVNRELAETGSKTFHFAVMNQPAFQFVMYTAVVLIMWFGGNMVLNFTLQVGDLTGFLSYVFQIMNSLMMISNVFLLLSRSLAGAKRVAEVLDENIVLTSPKNGCTDIKDGSVEFRNVSFKYRADAEAFALSHVSVTIQAGQTVGILGGTGSAKSTLVQLIPRLYDATTGEVLVGGRNVREYDLASLRDAVGIVLQKNVLFSGTVRENLAWGNPNATDEQMWQALKTAAADEFLMQGKRGLDTDLGQGGVNLSGGQKQRVCIARALLKNPKILIFDDSTSAVDMATEKTIRDSLSDLHGMTKIIIAQRISSVIDTDLILVLDDGKLHDAGTHDELLARDPIYQEIYASQMRKEAD